MIHTPSRPAKSSMFFAAKSTGTRGADSPVPGPFSPGLATCAVRNPFDAAWRRSSLWAATIITSFGCRFSAAAVIRYTAGFGLKSRAISEPKIASQGILFRRAMSTISAMLPFEHGASMNLRFNRTKPGTVSGQVSRRCQARLRTSATCCRASPNQTSA